MMNNELLQIVQNIEVNALYIKYKYVTIYIFFSFKICSFL